MSFELLTERNVVAIFNKALNVDAGQSYLGRLTREFSSTQSKETYAFASSVPSMTSWVGGRERKELSELSVVAENSPFQATIDISRAELRRDNTGMIVMRLNELAARANSHWNQLTINELLASTSKLGYDGKNFISSTHQTRDSGIQSNAISVDISTLAIPADEQGSTTSPSARTMKAVIFKAIQQILSFSDESGEPVNEDATSFSVMCGTSMMDSVSAALNNDFFAGNETNNLKSIPGVTIDFYATPRLNSVTDAIYVYRDNNVPTFIRQSEKSIQIEILGEGSDHAFRHNGWAFGVSADRGITNYNWQNIVRAQLV